MRTFIAILSWLVIAAPVLADAPKNKADSKPLRFRMNPFHVNVGKIETVKPSGVVQVKDLANPRFFYKRNVTNLSDLTEGYYLGVIAEDFLLSTEDAKVLRVLVTEVGKQGSATLRVGSIAAGKIKAGEDIILFRPPGSTTAQIKAAPDFAPVEDTSASSALGGSRRLSFSDRARLVQSQSNLRQIGLAMHNYHDVYNHLPPAYIVDEKGKPLLSWRVLILPYLEGGDLRDQFHMDEPWDSPHNKKLLSKMPSVYRDPIHVSDEGHYTHYAAIVGKNAAFSPGGAPAGRKPALGKSFGSFTDGLSNTIFVGSVSPDRKIPWTKPEDVKLTDKFPPLGKKGSFATPYRTSSASAGVFLYGDASVRTIRSDINIGDLRNLLRINDGNVVGEIPQFEVSRRQRRSKPQVQYIEIIRGKDGAKARFVSETRELVFEGSSEDSPGRVKRPTIRSEPVPTTSVPTLKEPSDSKPSKDDSPDSVKDDGGEKSRSKPPRKSPR